MRTKNFDVNIGLGRIYSCFPWLGSSLASGCCKKICARYISLLHYVANIPNHGGFDVQIPGGHMPSR